jgi:hypothetical protein
MQYTASCAQCGKEGHDFGTVSAEVQLKLHPQPCVSCRKSHTDRTWVVFCSPECLVLYASEKGFADEVASLEERAMI